MSSPSVTAALRSVKLQSQFMPWFDSGSSTIAQKTEACAQVFKAKYGALPAKIIITDKADDGTRSTWFVTEVTKAMASHSVYMVYAYGQQSQPQQTVEEYDDWNAGYEAWQAEQDELDVLPCWAQVEVIA